MKDGVRAAASILLLTQEIPSVSLSVCLSALLPIYLGFWDYIKTSVPSLFIHLRLLPLNSFPPPLLSPLLFISFYFAGMQFGQLTHLSSVDVVQDEVEFVGRLEGVVQAHQERVLDIL